MTTSQRHHLVVEELESRFLPTTSGPQGIIEPLQWGPVPFVTTSSGRVTRLDSDGDLDSGTPAIPGSSDGFDGADIVVSRTPGKAMTLDSDGDPSPSTLNVPGSPDGLQGADIPDHDESPTRVVDFAPVGVQPSSLPTPGQQAENRPPVTETVAVPGLKGGDFGTAVVSTVPTISVSAGMTGQTGQLVAPEVRLSEAIEDANPPTSMSTITQDAVSTLANVAAPIVVDSPAVIAVTGLLGLNVAQLQNGASRLLDQVSNLAAEFQDEGTVPTESAWLAAGILLASGAAGYAWWVSGRPRSIRSAAGQSLVTTWCGVDYDRRVR
jgi:hypothetical protein